MIRTARTALCAGVAATGLVAGGALPGTASADAGPPFTVTGSAEQFPNGFSGAVNPSGTTAYAWTLRRTVRFRIRSAGGRLGPALRVSTGSRVALTPQVALDSRGNAVVAWHEQTGASTYALYAAVRPRGRGFGAPQRLATSDFFLQNADSDYPLVEFDPRGNALAAWRYPGSRVAVAWAAPGRQFAAAQRLRGVRPGSVGFRADGGAVMSIFGSRAQVNEATAAPRGRFALTGTPFQVPVGPQGVADLTARQGVDSTALIAWREGYEGDEGVGPDPGPVHAAVRPPGGAFGPEQVISEPQPCGGAGLNTALRMNGSVTAGSEALVAWEQCVGDPSAPTSRFVIARRWSLAGGWSHAAPLGARSDYGYAPSIAPDGRGNAVVAWLAGDRDIAVRTMRPGGEFTPAELLRASSDARRTGPKAAAAGDRVLVMWGTFNGYQAAVGTTAP